MRLPIELSGKGQEEGRLTLEHYVPIMPACAHFSLSGKEARQTAPHIMALLLSLALSSSKGNKELLNSELPLCSSQELEDS